MKKNETVALGNLFYEVWIIIRVMEKPTFSHRKNFSDFSNSCKFIQYADKNDSFSEYARYYARYIEYDCSPKCIL